MSGYRVNVQMSGGLWRQLDELASRAGVTRDQWVRDRIAESHRLVFSRVQGAPMVSTLRSGSARPRPEKKSEIAT